MYDDLFTRSFTKHEQKKLSVWAFVGAFVFVLSFCVVLNSYMGPLPLFSFQLADSLNMKLFSVIDMKSNTSWPLEAGEVVNQVQVKRFEPVPTTICNFSLPKSDYCEINGDVRINGNTSSIYASSSLLDYTEGNNNNSLKLRPYARKLDKNVMKRVRELSLGSPSSFGLDHMPHCSINHSVPAIVFSCGGYAGNYFHDFSDILVPLFITSKPFDGKVQFLVTDIMPWWLIKYRALLSSLSKYPIIDADSSKEVHCFKNMTIGLKGHKEFGIDPSLTSQGYSMENFTQFVRNAYALERTKLGTLKVGGFRRPRILIISRKRSRALDNEDEVAEEARSLGYDVEVVDAQKRLKDFSKMVNSFDVMVGVHGAGLTNCIFLPENAVLIQVVPLGLEWLSTHDFAMPAAAMKLRYLEYRIGGNESSLADKYGLDHPLIRDPKSIKPQGWFAFKKVYLDGQSVRIDVARFRDTLLKALELLKQ